MLRTRTTLTATAAALLLAACSSSATTGSTTATEGTTTSAATSSNADAALPSSYTLPGQGVFPEGITSSGDSFWVTSTTDGAVFRGTVDDPAATLLAPGGRDGRTSAAGTDVTADGAALLVAGGATGQVSVLDATTGDTLRTFTDGLGSDATFLNDVAVAPNGDAYVTDSRSPSLYRIPADEIGTPGPTGAPLQVAVDLTGTPFVYGDGFNANGIVVTEDGRHAVVVQSSTGTLYRVDLTSREVTAVDLGGTALTSGDGMELAPGGPLYVVRNSLETVAVVDLAADAASGTVTGQPVFPDLQYPTTATVLGDRLLLVNSQFDQRGGTPVEPFTIGAVPLP